jgi:hypothetical protein
MKEPVYSQKQIDKNLRRNTIDAITLFASRHQQVSYRKNVPIADVLAEMFINWHETYGCDDPKQKEYFKSLFAKEENEILNQFDKVFQDVQDENTALTFEDFLDSPHWLKLYKAARQTLRDLKIELPKE